MPPDTIQLLLGNNLRILASSKISALSRSGKTFLSIGISDGLMRLTTTVLDNSSQYICRIIDNEFQANPERAFNPKQPDDHSLIVRDGDGHEVLNVRFLNPTTIRVTGRFQFPGFPNPLLINDGGMFFPNGGDPWET